MLMRFAGALLLSGAPLLTTPALADAAGLIPVKAIMDLAVDNAKAQLAPISGDEQTAPAPDYFDADHIKYFTAKFQALYRKAAKHASDAADGDFEGLFDYDWITASQEYCPILDYRLEARPAKGKLSEFVVTFKPYGCAEMGNDDRVRTLTFQVVNDKGRPLINDILWQFDGDQGSATGDLKDSLDDE
jgi:hypothetical protein